MTYDIWKTGYKTLWDEMLVVKTDGAKKQAGAILACKSRYLAIAAQVNVPWFVLGIIHTREAGSPPDFRAVLHNGERIVGTGRLTTLVPKGRGPFPTFEASVKDAVALEHYSDIKWADGWGPEHVAYVLEEFNGTGYRSRGIPSPYLWGGTSVQKPGKFVRDGVYSPTTIDTQIGGMAILKELMLLDSSIQFGVTVSTPDKVEPTHVNPPVVVPTPVGPSTEPKEKGPEVSPKPTVNHKGKISLAALAVGYFHQHWMVILGVLTVVALAYVVYRLWPVKQLSPKTD